MSSVICQNFVQNAWKKELCSNCFKSKSEHIERTQIKPLPTISKRIHSIINNGKKYKKTARCVRFPNQLTEVIGVGGEDWSSDTDDEDDLDYSEEECKVESEDEDIDKELQRITKVNTDFNSNALKVEPEVKKSYTQLTLGKPIVDSDGKKKTLLVTVTPFGEESKKVPKLLSHVPISRSNKEHLTEIKSNVVLTSYTKNDDETMEKEEKSLLDEITETLEKCKNPIQIISRKKIQKEITLSMPSKESNKENIENDYNQNEENVEVSKATLDKKHNLTRTPPLKKETEKPVILQTTTAKIELLNTKNNKMKVEKGSAKPEVNNNEKTESNVKSQNRCNGALISANLIKEEIVNNCKLEMFQQQLTLKETEKISVKSASNTHKQNVSTLQSTMSKCQEMTFSQSREQAGEPDGRADPDNTIEPPALPLSPPPALESQTSFLHCPTPIYQKPKLPSKPSTVLIRKPVVMNQNFEVKNQVLTTFACETMISEDHKKLTKQDSNGSDVASHVSNKRKAPKPPEETGAIYLRNSLGPVNIDSPVVREKDKRDRVSSCNAKMLAIPNNIGGTKYCAPEPAPRKSLSVSTDSLIMHSCEDRKKEKSKGRFSLKKFLRMGSNKDLTKIPLDVQKIDDIDTIPLPKPRLIIVHPSELNGSKVEVVAKSPNLDQVDAQNFEVKPEKMNDIEVLSTKATKPPPPPRNLEDYSQKPLPPTKSVDVVNKQKQATRHDLLNQQQETVYANIGEVRSAITPNKPVRTASMREREAQQQKEKKQSPDNYEPIDVGTRELNNENLYDYINNGRSSSPDSDSSREKQSPTIKTVRLNKRSESSIDVSGDYFKYNNIPRSVSLTYCGSETESEIYSPYSFYGSESEVTEDDHEWIQNGRTHKLRSRKGRSIVHKNLEDNYGAVIVANHEALAQVLENIQQTVHIQPALRGLKTLPNLRWVDFTVQSSSAVMVGRRAFYQAVWGTHHVTLCICAGPAPSSTVALGTFNLSSVTEFSDLIPTTYLLHNEDTIKQVQATITVLPWIQVNTIQSFSEGLKAKTTATSDDIRKEAIFVLLQLVNALKSLQAQGIEELPLSLNSFVLCKDMERDVHPKLFILQGLSEELAHKSDEDKFGTLCMCAAKVLQVLQPAAKISSLVQSLLNNERAVSLTQVKSVLEFSLWGPSDVALGSTIRERELALQRWLDLQRATVLHGLVCTRVQLTAYEECHLLFLVRSNARMMCDASLLLESSNMKHIALNGHK